MPYWQGWECPSRLGSLPEQMLHQTFSLPFLHGKIIHDTRDVQKFKAWKISLIFFYNQAEKEQSLWGQKLIENPTHMHTFFNPRK